MFVYYYNYYCYSTCTMYAKLQHRVTVHVLANHVHAHGWQGGMKM